MYTTTMELNPKLGFDLAKHLVQILHSQKLLYFMLRTFYESVTVSSHIYRLLPHMYIQMIPIEKFEAQSMNGNFVPIVPGGGNIHLTYHNRKEYIEKA